ncbi:MAG: MotA/TolQ/ExbB proton channel family protein [Verrucomicrobiota bacterium]
MEAGSPSLFEEFSAVWMSGGWLMGPLFILAVFIYFTAIDLFIQTNGNFLLRHRVYRFTDERLASEANNPMSLFRPFFLHGNISAFQIKRHFAEVRNEYLPKINRRIRFLAIITTTSPLVGLLGTVTGMLSTFSGMVETQGSKFENIVEGISEALITTQTGLMISIPALVVISLIIQSRNRLVRSIARLEYINLKQAQNGTKAA